MCKLWRLREREKEREWRCKPTNGVFFYDRRSSLPNEACTPTYFWCIWVRKTGNVKRGASWISLDGFPFLEVAQFFLCSYRIICLVFCFLRGRSWFENCNHREGSVINWFNSLFRLDSRDFEGFSNGWLIGFFLLYKRGESREERHEEK